MNQILIFLGSFTLLVFIACQPNKVPKQITIDEHPCENIKVKGDTTVVIEEMKYMFDSIVTRDTVEYIALQISEYFKGRRTLSYDEQDLQNYFNDNFAKIVSYDRFRGLLPNANAVLNREHWLAVFPVRIAIVIRPGFEKYIPEKDLQHSMDILNAAFKGADIKFKITDIDTIYSPLTIENLKEGGWQKYFDFSDSVDIQDTINLYFFDNDPNLCKVAGESVICGRTGGFSYILSNYTNNIVLTKFEVGDQKVIAHEFGHYFGLYHTFEAKYGKEDVGDTFCDHTGDKICDTPADPGTSYEVYVNYTRCEMEGFFDDNGLEYKPMVNNYMSYYKPCYMKPYQFSEGQLDVIYKGAHSRLRKHFIIEYDKFEEEKKEDKPVFAN
jgi:hypothetical protein